MNGLARIIKHYIELHRKDRRIRTVVTTLACVVVFITTYMLIYPALSLEKNAQCGIEAHEHTEECYTQVLSCGLEETDGHTHNDGCYETEDILVCGLDEHTHNEDCYDEEGSLICDINEHVHDDGCYEQKKTLVCDQEECEPHWHDTSCYKEKLTCGKEVHIHSEACYKTQDQSLAAAKSEVKPDTDHKSENNLDKDQEKAADAPSTGAVFGAETEKTDSAEKMLAEGASHTSGETDKQSDKAENVSEKSETRSETSNDAEAAAKQGTDEGKNRKKNSDKASSEELGDSKEETDSKPLPEISFSNMLTDTTGLWAKNDKGKWKRIDEDTDLAWDQDILIRIGYEIPEGMIDAGNASVSFKLPKKLNISKQTVRMVNAEENHLNQIIEGDRLPGKKAESEEYLAGRYELSRTRRGRGTLDITFSDYTISENAGRSVSGWLVFYVKASDLPAKRNGKGSLTFAKKSSSGENVRAEYVIGDKASETEAPAADEDEDKISESSMGDETTLSGNDKKDSDSSDGRPAERKITSAEAGGVDESEHLSVESADGESGSVETESDTSETKDADTVENSEGTEALNSESASERESSAIESKSETETGVETGTETETETETETGTETETESETGTETESESETKADTDMPAVTFEQGTDEVDVKVYAEEGTFPAGTSMTVMPVDDQETVDAIADSLKDSEGTSRSAQRIHAVDITFQDSQGNEIEPSKPVCVIMEAKEKQSKNDWKSSSSEGVAKARISDDAPVVVNVDDEGQAAVIDQSTPEEISASTDITGTEDADRAEEITKEIQDASESTTAAVFTTDSFSVYAVVYTVDFHWEVDGKTYDFSIPGGGFVSLEHVVEVLGIASTDENTENGVENAANGTENENDYAGEVPGAVVSDENGEGGADKYANGGASPSSDSTACEDTIKLNDVEVSEAAKKFVADVESVEFSSPESVWIGKVDEETTVRELKELKELEVKYSGELTVTDISKINTQAVEAGDWALISVQPFVDEQTLTITMKDGDVFAIQVAGQVHSDDVRVQYSSADGDTVITACASMGTLPEGTKIQIREIDPYTDFPEDIEEEAKLYAESCGAVANKLWQENRTLSEAKVVDISFVDVDGNKIEPEGDVDVSLLLAEALETVDDGNLGLAHIPSGEAAEVELLEANIDGCETVFTSDDFSIYVIFNGDPYTGTLQPVNFDVGWISFGGDMQARSELPNGVYNWWAGQYPSPEGAWKWLTVNLYELKDGVSEDAYNNFDNYNLLDTYSYIAGNTDIVVEDYGFKDRELLCTRFHRTNSTSWDFYDAKNGVETKVNYGGAAVQYGWTDIVPGLSGYWHLEPNVLNIYLSQEKEVVREPSTDYVIRYYHADGSYDTVTGSLTAANPSLSLPADYKIIDGREVFSGLSIGAGHSALSANTSTGSMMVNFNENVSLVKANVYYKENIEVMTGGPVSGQPLYDTKTENGRKIYDTSRTGLHTDKTATPITNSANAALNDGRTFNLTLESWNVGANYANVGMILDASGSMVWPSDLPEEVTVPKDTLSNYGSKTTHNIKTGNGSSNTSVTGYFLTEAQVNSILNTNYVDNSKLGYNGYRYYLKDPAANVNEYVPLGYYDGANLNGVNFSPNGNGTRGWYYVTSADVKHYQNDGTGKQYCKFQDNNDAWQNAGSTATQFWLDDEGVLHGYWYRSSGGNYYWNSKVYVSPANADNKSEILQYGLGRFAATLLANSPTSQISMVRFSRARKENSFTAAELALLNWTTDTKLVTAAMNQQYGNDTSTGFDNQNGLKVYNYGFTGDTSTGSGIDAYINDLTKKAAGNYVATSGNANNSKYLIIFTDGKDTDPATSNDNYRFNRATSNSEATNLKNQGYTIFTVMMQSAGMSPSDVTDAEGFLRGLAGTKTENGYATNSDGSNKYYFNFMYDDPTALVEAFQKIAKEIAKPLDGYMVRDYIDPRFDLLDADGNVITRLNRNGVWMPRFITTADGKTALLKYDTEREMFYVEIENQSLPTSPQNATDVTVNTVQLTVRAKDDFIGGNDILTNGNEAGQNQVFKPVDNYAIEVNEPVAANPDTAKYPKKDYPKTTANPATYGTTLLNYEDTIFLDETISPVGLFEQVSTMDDETANDNHLSVYAGYLSRAGKKLHDDENYYINILQNGALPSGHLNVNGEVITITDKIVTIELPYYYLKDENDIRSYAGGELHQADKTGTITYTWKAVDTGGHTLTDNNAFKDFTSTTLDTVKYQLSMSYTPDPYVPNDSIANNGSARTLTLTNQTGTDKLIRDPVGNTAISQSTDTTKEGFAVIHVVAGKIGVTKKISKQDLDDLGIAVSDLPSVTFSLTKDGATYKTVTADMTKSTLKEGYYELTVWETDLPKGIYTVSEEPGDSYKLASFEALTIQDDSATANVNESQFAAKYSSDSDAKTVTWYIGPKGETAERQPDVSTYPDCVNGTVLFPYNLVTDTLYHVDPDLAVDNGKYYLNGQIGQAVYINKLNPFVMLRKADMTDSSRPLNGAVFNFYKEVSAGTTGALTELIPEKNVVLVSTVTSGDYEQETGTDAGEKLAGYVSLGALDTDGIYYLVEDIVPVGCVSPEWKYVMITLSDDQISWTAYKEDGSIYGSPQSAEKEIIDGKNCYTVTILNNPGAALPNTGGSGTTVFYLFGCILMMLAGAGYVIMRRQRSY